MRKGVEQYVDHLLSQANESAVHAYETTAFLENKLSDICSSTDVGAINSRRAWIIDQLASIIRNQRLPRADTWIKNILDWLTVHGLFMIKKKSSKIPFPVVRNPFLSDVSNFLHIYSCALFLLLHYQTNFGKLVEINCWPAWVTCAIRLW
jgi:hypothetical protein